ncbi:hypothetical protein ACMV8I_02665 [Ewingella sp. S1.OA.A_B6]
MHIKWILSAALISNAFGVQAQTPPEYQGWTYFAKTDVSNFYFKNGSGRFENGIRTLFIQQVPTEKSSDTVVDYKKVAISEKDCKNGYGSVLLYTPSGKLTDTVDYVKGGVSIASGLVDHLCILDFSK